MEKACCIIDFEGFLVPKRSATGSYDVFQFLLREVAYVRISSQETYSPSSRFFDLSKIEWPVLDSTCQKAIKTQENLIGLTFLPTEQEKQDKIVLDYDLRYEYLKELQTAYTRGDKCSRKDVIAFYDGQYEETYLRIAGIPSCSLKSYNCPDYDSVVVNDSSYLDITCGFHRNGRLDTCPRARVAVLRDWWMRRFSWQKPKK